MRVAAVDCGTNSIRLLVADVAAQNGAPMLTDLSRRMEVVRLGQGVDRTGRINPQALDRTLAALRRYADEARELGAERVRMVATSATRDAVRRLHASLTERGFDAVALSGEHSQNERNHALQALRDHALVAVLLEIGQGDRDRLTDQAATVDAQPAATQ